MFDIKDSIDFYGFMLENYDDFVEQPRSSQRAVNCAISAFHMAEWIWGDWVKQDQIAQRQMGGPFCDKDDFLRWIDTETKFFQVVQGITNGSKHFARNLWGATKATGTYVEGYVRRGYQETYLEIEVDDKWIEAIVVIQEVVTFWTRFLQKYRPQQQLPQPRKPSPSGQYRVSRARSP